MRKLLGISLIFMTTLAFANKDDLYLNGSYMGLLGGMGINHEMGPMDFYFESTLFPIPDIGMYIVDFEFGLRFYL